MLDISTISSILFKQLHAPLTVEEERILTDWLEASSQHRALFESINNEEALREQLFLFQEDQKGLMEERILAGLKSQLFEERLISGPVHRVHLLKTAWFKYAAAIIILFGVGAYLWNNYNKAPESTTATITPSSSDILPGGQKATLTLADGRTIILDSAQNGQLATENGSEIIKRGDEIIYDAGQIHSEAVVYNTMTTPKGGQYQLTLPDGTKVWLNAASKIIYPTRFVGKTREVKVEGEVYFEVKANSKIPFIVKTNTDEITVLGTEFNVNNYSDEPASKISLIEGSVKVNKILLQPGQAYSNGKIMQTNIEQDVAWRNGYFYFVNADLPSVMRQLARWYDLEVKYDKDVAARTFEGKLSRELYLSDVLDALSTMQIRYQLQGRTLTIQ